MWGFWIGLESLYDKMKPFYWIPYAFSLSEYEMMHARLVYMLKTRRLCTLLLSPVNRFNPLEHGRTMNA